MALRAFSVVGEALHFATRRFETVLRVAALPLALLLVFNMAAAFGYLSVANARIVTFSDLAAANVGWAKAAVIAAKAAENGLAAGSPKIWAIYGASLLVNAILVAAFLAPLIRYAGLGEKPPPGVVRIPFGLDQARFLAAGALSALLFLLVVYAPVLSATLAVAGFISGAMTTPYASFPDTDSLHTIDIVAGAEAFGVRILHSWQPWIAAGFVLALLLVAVFAAHVRPRGADKSAGVGFLGRLLGVGAGIAAWLAFCVVVYMAAMRSLSDLMVAAGGKALSGALGPDALAAAFFASAALTFAAYVSLRLFPYSGIAVCRRSMALAPALRLTRRYDLFRLAFAFVAIGVILAGAQILLIGLGGGAALAVVGYLAAAVESAIRLTGGAEASQWVFPFFKWLWAVIGILFTLLWTAFTYGVTAGLFGRLYCDSAR